MIFCVNDYGAKGDGKTNDTKAIQAAIDACHKRGGGKVVFNGGQTYRSGTLILRSYVELHLESEVSGEMQKYINGPLEKIEDCKEFVIS